MSGQQHIDWYETAREMTGAEKLMDLEVLVAPNEEGQFYAVRDKLMEMASGSDK